MPRLQAELIGSDPFRRKKDCNPRSRRSERIAQLKEAPPVLATVMTLFFRGAYYGFKAFKLALVFALNYVERELRTLGGL